MGNAFSYDGIMLQNPHKGNITQENPTVGLPEVSKLMDSAISKGQVDRRKHSFLERKKKYCIKGKMDSL